MKYAALCLNSLALALVFWGLYGIWGLVGARLPASTLPAVELRALPDKALAEQKQVSATSTPWPSSPTARPRARGQRDDPAGLAAAGAPGPAARPCRTAR
jgi:hypothetical protein